MNEVLGTVTNGGHQKFPLSALHALPPPPKLLRRHPFHQLKAPGKMPGVTHPQLKANLFGSKRSFRKQKYRFPMNAVLQTLV